MQKVFIGLLVGFCIIIFASLIMAADSPKAIDLSTLQPMKDAQLKQITGKAYTSEVPGLMMLVTNIGMENMPVYSVAGLKRNRMAGINSRVFNFGNKPQK